jgi:tRNA A-37 threonylcarbamoyl transferase component Bud32
VEVIKAQKNFLENPLGEQLLRRSRRIREDKIKGHFSYMGTATPSILRCQRVRYSYRH